MKILCSICARGGSTTLKNKNIKKLFGKPLIFYTLNVAKRSGIFDKIVVSSDSNKILNLAKKKVDLAIKRPKKLSHDSASKIEAIKHALITSENFFNKNFDVIIDLDTTSPLRTKQDILNAKNIFLKKNYSNLVSVCYSNKNPYYNMIEKKNKSIQIVKHSKINYLCRQKTPIVFDINASIYIWWRDVLLKTKKLINNKTGTYLMPKSRSIDIDDFDDFKLVEYYMKKNKKK